MDSYTKAHKTFPNPCNAQSTVSIPSRRVLPCFRYGCPGSWRSEVLRARAPEGRARDCGRRHGLLSTSRGEDLRTAAPSSAKLLRHMDHLHPGIRTLCASVHPSRKSVRFVVLVSYGLSGRSHRVRTFSRCCTIYAEQIWLINYGSSIWLNRTGVFTITHCI